uniref:DUF3365 domain-containing protein n=1 Tax=Schlesneria paludicola TaxID=360056 RepID=A0A7C2P288_9PLAN
MIRRAALIFLSLTGVVGPLAMVVGAPPDRAAPAARSVEEARGRAQLLHEAIHAALQVVHHEYYREDQGLTIPAVTLRRVFGELANRHKVELRWLAVNAQAMNVEHKPRDDFEKQAVEALAKGQPDYEQVADGMYRFAGAITLSSECLKCHLPNRTSTKDRAAGLVIALPLAAP